MMRRLPRIAILHHGSVASPALLRLRQALAARGVAHGRSCLIDEAGADRRLQQLPALADSLLSRDPDILVAIGAVAALAAQRATRCVPVLHATVLDPQSIGLTAPNLAGITTFDPGHAPRQIRLLQDVVPALRAIACLFDPAAPHARDGASPLVTGLRLAAADAGIGLHCIALHGSDAQAEPAIDRARQAGCAAVVALEMPSVLACLADIARTAARHALPVLLPQGYGVPGMATPGPGLPDAAAALAGLVVAVLQGRPVSGLLLGCLWHGQHRAACGTPQPLGLAGSRRLAGAGCRS